MKIVDWNIEQITGYKPLTTYYMDFSIADHFGEEAIRETYERAKETCVDYKWLTELVMVLNWKIWEHHETNDTYGKLYEELWRELVGYVLDNLEGEELSYYFRTTD